MTGERFRKCRGRMTCSHAARMDVAFWNGMRLHEQQSANKHNSVIEEYNLRSTKGSKGLQKVSNCSVKCVLAAVRSEKKKTSTPHPSDPFQKSVLRAAQEKHLGAEQRRLTRPFTTDSEGATKETGHCHCH